MEKFNRKAAKQTAKKAVKKYYWLLVLLCLISAVIGSDYAEELQAFKMNSSTEVEADSSVTTTYGLDGLYEALVDDNVEQYQQKVEEKVKEDQKHDILNVGILQIGRSRGALASMVNQVSSGTLFIAIYSAIHSAIGSKTAGMVIFVILALMFYMAIWIMFISVYDVIMARFTLEMRVYDKVPLGRFLFLFRIRCWIRVALSLIRKIIYEFLWGLTVVGGIIKKFSYFCVPYILAENPKATGKEAILLSRRMMDGHKWELFKLRLSFILWHLLGIVTLGLGYMFFVNPYRACTEAEYYAQLRNDWVKNKKEGSELFTDRYLFEKADTELLQKTYADFKELRAIPEEKFEGGHFFAKFMALNFGVILKHTDEEMKYLRSQSIRQKIAIFAAAMDGIIYPSRLSPTPEKEKVQNLEDFGSLRCYTITSLILIFFSMSIVGWLWEVSLHLITSHQFVNRGVLHGPWLPIYGTGGMVILLLLNRFRKKPQLEFLLGMLLAGIVEYTTAWHLETTHNGQKWWDYSGYFLNLHGRVCAEGLVVFGLGGLAVVYVLAPLLDNLFRKIPMKIVVPLCAVLLVFYIGDNLYSHNNPNSGAGITDYEAGIEIQEEYSISGVDLPLQVYGGYNR